MLQALKTKKVLSVLFLIPRKGKEFSREEPGTTTPTLKGDAKQSKGLGTCKHRKFTESVW